MHNYLAVFFLFFIYFSAFEGSETSLWDLVVKQEQVFLTVEHHGRYLNVWRQNVGDYYRFYVTPLCIMDIESISCSRDEYSDGHRHQHIFQYDIKLWDWKAAEAVKQALKRKNISVNADDILPLPMQEIRVDLRRKNLKLKVDNQWRSNQDQPHKMSFDIYVKHKKFCEKMISDAKNDMEQFLKRIQLFFEFTMITGQTESRSFKITGKNLQKSSFFNKLLNYNSDNDGIVYLQSKDINELTHDIFNKVVFEEEMSADYIPSEQEEKIILELLNVFKQHQIQSNDLSKEEWNSVFWNNIFSRPDIQTQHFNEILKYDESLKEFKYDGEKDKKFQKDLETKYKTDDSSSGGGSFSSGGSVKYLGIGFGGSSSISGHGKGASSSNNETKSNLEKNEKNILKFDDLQKAIKKEHVNVKWTGEKFVPKNLYLYRLNVKTLNLSNEIYLRRIIVKKFRTTQKIEIKAEPKNDLKSIFEHLSDSSIAKPSPTCLPCPSHLPPMPCPPSLTCPTPQNFTCQPLVLLPPLPCPTQIPCQTPQNLTPPPTSRTWLAEYILYGTQYKITQKNMTWDSARDYCQTFGGQLASIHSQQEKEFLTSLYSKGNAHWIGSYYSPSNKNWLWSDGSYWDYNPWGNKYDYGGCGAIGGKDMFNMNCHHTQKVICSFLAPS